METESRNLSLALIISLKSHLLYLRYLFAIFQGGYHLECAEMKPTVLHARKMQITRPTIRAPLRASRSVSVYCRVNTTPADAIVIGGGIAGMLAASVLSKRVDNVVLIEKDDITGTVETETFGEVSLNGL